MKRKSLATIIICIISVMILAGCGTAAESNSADKPEAVEEDAEIAEDSERKNQKRRHLKWQKSPGNLQP